MEKQAKVKYNSRYLNLIINAYGVPRIEFKDGRFETDNKRQITAIENHRFYASGLIKRVQEVAAT
jgi:hypothetical protein